MSDNSAIEWTDSTWNPIVGCSIVSPGCTNCYAMAMAARIDKMTLASHYEGLTKKVNGNQVWTGKVARANDHIFSAPLRWRKPKRIFVNSMGDLFHESIPDEWIDRVFAVMALAPQHTFQVLTKRAERMREYLDPVSDRASFRAWMQMPKLDARALGCDQPKFPLPNVWLGVSAERQEEWDERKEHLRNTPAVVRFASFEPLLGKIVERHLADYLHWGIIGGESGSNARDTWIPDVRSLLRQHQRQGVRVFVKQLGANVQDRDDAGFEGCSPTEWPMMDLGCIEPDPNGYIDGGQGSPVRIHLKDRKGGDWSEWPEDLRVREFPVIDSSVTQSGSSSPENQKRRGRTRMTIRREAYGWRPNRDTVDMFEEKERGRFGDNELASSSFRVPTRSDLIDLNLVLHLDSPKKQAIAVSPHHDTPFERWAWLPRSEIEYETTGYVKRTRTCRVTLPEYLATKKGLV